jgi:hypothetical protein
MWTAAKQNSPTCLKQGNPDLRPTALSCRMDETRLNTATATLQNYAYDHEGVGEEAGTTDFSGTADIDFSEANGQSSMSA